MNTDVTELKDKKKIVKCSCPINELTWLDTRVYLPNVHAYGEYLGIVCIKDNPKYQTVMPIVFVPTNDYTDGKFHVNKSVKNGYSDGTVLAWMQNPDIEVVKL